MKREFKWLFGADVDWIGYRKSGSYGMYGPNIRHHWVGIFWIIGFRYTVSWGN